MKTTDERKATMTVKKKEVTTKLWQKTDSQLVLLCE